MIGRIIVLVLVCVWMGFFIVEILPALVRRFLEGMRRWATDETEPTEPDPCSTCQRWGECNGVDRDNCPLWRDYDRKEE